MWIQLLIISSFFFFYSCCRDPITYTQTAFTKRFPNEMYDSNNWCLLGFGGGFHDGFDNLSFKFTAEDSLHLEQARRLIVNNFEYLYELINSDPQLLPYLSEVPLSRKNIELGIMFVKNKSMDYIDTPYISYVTCINGKIGYGVFNKETQILDLIHREIYEEAFKIVYGHSDECK